MRLLSRRQFRHRSDTGHRVRSGIVRPRFLPALIALATVAGPAGAQDSYLGSAYIDAGIGTAGIQAAMQSAQQQVGTKMPQALARPVKLAYAASLTRTRTNLAHFVDKTRITDPAGAAKMQALFASTDIIGVIDRKMQLTYGMRANNVADAYAVWWVSAWMGARGRSDDATPGQMAMVQRQATNALAATPEFASATDAGKQEMAEALLVQAALIGDAVDTYKSDPAMLAKTRAAIGKGALGMGLDLGSMTLTDDGFVSRRKTDGD
jgi:hypothetical protein